jgi:L-malate glycosyltransferase
MLLHATTYLQGGAGRAVTDLAVAARRGGHAVAVAATRTPVPGYENYPQYLQALAAAGVPVILVDSTFDRSVESGNEAVASIAAAIPPSSLSLVHAHAGTPARIGLALSSLARREGRVVPVVQTMHGWGTTKTPRQERDDLATLNQMDAVVVTSHASADDVIRRGIDPARVVAIPCGLDAELPVAPPVHPIAQEAMARRAEGTRVLLCIGTINRNKNQSTLVRALAAILARRLVLCVFVGEGVEAADLREVAGASGVQDAVRFVGYQPDAASWLTTADLLVQPSLAEGQGLAVLEAFRAGIPVVASDIPAHRELIGETGGWLFDPTSAEDLARAADRALSVDRRECERRTARARDAFQARYTVEAMVAAHQRLYASVLAGRP